MQSSPVEMSHPSIRACWQESMSIPPPLPPVLRIVRLRRGAARSARWAGRQARDCPRSCPAPRCRCSAHRSRKVNQTDAAFAFPAHLRHRVVGEIGRAQYRGILVEPQQRVRLQCQCAGEVSARRHQHLFAAQPAGEPTPRRASQIEMSGVEGEYSSKRQSKPQRNGSRVSGVRPCGFSDLNS